MVLGLRSRLAPTPGGMGVDGLVVADGEDGQQQDDADGHRPGPGQEAGERAALLGPSTAMISLEA